MKTISLSLLLMLLFSTVASAQTSDKIKPKWLQRLPAPTNSTFKYEIVSASATSLDAARNKCLTELISSSGLSQGVVISSNYNSTEKLSQKWDNGKLAETVEYNTQTITSGKSKESEIFIENIDEYWFRSNTGDYFLTKLYAVSGLGKVPLFDNVELTSLYGVHGFWRSAIVPGWGQFFKGANTKGKLILGGTVALAGGIIFAENQRADYVRKIAQTHDADIKRAYATQSDHFATGRNICIGAVAALYVYNLIDSVVSPGARHIIVHRHPGGNTYAVLPTVSSDGNPVVMASITF